MNTATAVDLQIDTGGRSAAEPNDVKRIAFTGTGGEYFRIRIVNLLLTIVTVGIYSAWAKVRRMRYFYDNTRLAGSSFEYHGQPMAILKGRIIAVLIIGGYNLAFRFSPVAGFVMLGVLMLSFPWLIWKSLQFKLYYSSYRGIRFGFRGAIGKVYFNYIVLPLCAVLSLYTLLPFVHQRMKKFQHEESRFGTTHFAFDASVGSFYKIYLIGFATLIGGAVAISILFAGTLGAIFSAGGLKEAGPQILVGFIAYAFAMYAWLFMMFPLFLTLTQNLVWSHTSLAGNRFKCEMKWTRVAFIAITNVIGVVLTLGLFMPFAKVRMMKYRLESMSVIPEDSLDNFIASAQEQASAASEGMADILDFDISM